MARRQPIVHSRQWFLAVCPRLFAVQCHIGACHLALRFPAVGLIVSHSGVHQPKAKPVLKQQMIRCQRRRNFESRNVLDDPQARMTAWARQADAIVLAYTPSGRATARHPGRVSRPSAGALPTSRNLIVTLWGKLYIA